MCAGAFGAVDIDMAFATLARKWVQWAGRHRGSSGAAVRRSAWGGHVHDSPPGLSYTLFKHALLDLGLRRDAQHRHHASDGTMSPNKRVAAAAQAATQLGAAGASAATLQNTPQSRQLLLVRQHFLGVVNGLLQRRLDMVLGSSGGGGGGGGGGGSSSSSSSSSSSRRGGAAPRSPEQRGHVAGGSPPLRATAPPPPQMPTARVLAAGGDAQRGAQPDVHKGSSVTAAVEAVMAAAAAQGLDEQAAQLAAIDASAPKPKGAAAATAPRQALAPAPAVVPAPVETIQDLAAQFEALKRDMENNPFL